MKGRPGHSANVPAEAAARRVWVEQRRAKSGRNKSARSSNPLVELFLTGPAQERHQSSPLAATETRAKGRGTSPPPPSPERRRAADRVPAGAPTVACACVATRSLRGCGVHARGERLRACTCRPIRTRLKSASASYIVKKCLHEPVGTSGFVSELFSHVNTKRARAERVQARPGRACTRAPRRRRSPRTRPAFCS